MAHLLSSVVVISISCAALSVAFSVSNPAQVISGIGASGAWWPNDLFGFPDNVREQVAELLFSPSGASLTSYRYNVGGGGVGVTNPTRSPKTFYVSEGQYNWDVDPAGVYFLQKAAGYGVPQLTAFVNSAPPSMTSNSKSCGGTLVNSQIPAFARYLADIVAHFRDQGIRFTHVSPMNEPAHSFSDCGQEGMQVTPAQRANVVNTLRSALDAAGLQSVAIIADESDNAANFVAQAPQWIPSVNKSALAAVSHHQYKFDDDATVAHIGSVGRSLSGVDTWFTEICCFRAASSSQQSNPAAKLAYGSYYEPTMIGALQLGQVVYQSFTQAQDAHFDFWTALSKELGCSPSNNPSCATTANAEGWNDGLLYYDGDYASNHNTAVYQTKRLFLMKHLATFIWIGSTRYSVSDLPANFLGMAFKSSSQHSTPAGNARASLVLMNMGSSAAFVQPSQAGLGTFIGGAVTSSSTDWQIFGSSTPVSLPRLSITTLLFN